jgi:hypothetical protein
MMSGPAMSASRVRKSMIRELSQTYDGGHGGVWGNRVLADVTADESRLKREDDTLHF